MIPILFEIPEFTIFGLKIGPLPIGVYGLCMAVGFIVALFILKKELKRKNINPETAYNIVFFAILGGVIGAKGLSIIENWNQTKLDIWGSIFSGGGLTWYGGVILAAISVILTIKYSKLPLFRTIDCIIPPLTLGYGFGRLGCHLSGDGCYGIPTHVSWACSYADGIIKPLQAIPKDILEKFYGHYPPKETIYVHPTPVYEIIIAILSFVFIWLIRKKDFKDGFLFPLYLIILSIPRFFVEFIRLNEELLFGLSISQLISIALFIIGVVWISISYREDFFKIFKKSEKKEA